MTHIIDSPSTIVVRDAVRPYYGVVTREQLLAAGVPRSVVDRAIAVGRLVPLLPGVFVLDHAEVTWRTHCLARLRYVDRQLRRKWKGEGPRPVVAVTGTSAAVLHSVPHLDEEPTTTVLATSRRSRATVDRGLLLERSGLTPDECEEVEGVVVTGLAWTVVELIAVLLWSHAMNIVADLVRAGRLSLSELRAVGERMPEVADHLHAFLAWMTTEDLRARSDAERRLAEFIHRSGLPLPTVNHVLAMTLRTIELDFAWLDLRLDVELDGPHHLGDEQRARDRARDRVLEAAGWRVVRITVAEFEADPAAAVARIAAAVAEQQAARA